MEISHPADAANREDCGFTGQLYLDRLTEPCRASHPSGLLMKFRTPKGRLALHFVATVIKHMVLQPVRPKRPVLTSDAVVHECDGGWAEQQLW